MLQWFAVNLLTKKIGKSLNVASTALIVDVKDANLEVTLAVPSGSSGDAYRKHQLAASKLSAFGHSVKLVTLSYTGLGLYPARLAMLNKNGVDPLKREEEGEGEEEKKKRIELRSNCLNPIAEALWIYKGRSTLQIPLECNLLNAFCRLKVGNTTCGARRTPTLRS